ncbi:MAG: hydantoinase B/oxoprolinase family protein [Methyloligellaceae bacterium]
MLDLEELRRMAVSTAAAAPDERYWTNVEVDPVLLQVIGGAMKTAASEMAQLLFRMAYSSIMRESQDIGAGLLDRFGRQLCESDSTPMHCGSLPAYVKGIEKKLNGTYRPGDVVLHNHPYFGASHAPDYGILIPIFFADVHVGFAGCTGHMVDIGGAHPGFSVDVPDVYAEGKLINSAKIYDAGTLNEPLWDHILENVRTPEANGGDIEAMIACCRLGAERFTELLDRYGLDTVMSACESWLDYAEGRMRRRIGEIPDGVYEAPEGWLEDDGKNFGVPLRVATRVVVDGDDIYVDLTGSAPEVETGFNCPYEGSVLPTVNFAIRTLVLDEAGEGGDVPQNDGIFRPVKVYAPEGSIFNPRFPRGCEARFAQINRIPDQILQAFASAMPEQVTAGNSASVSAIAYAGMRADDPSQYWVLIEVNEGSYGARWGKDGIDAIDNLMANTRNNPVEEMELSAPVVCERYELREVAPAAGRWRGGLGSVKRWRFLEPTSIGSTGDHRSGDPPRGLGGGADGLPGAMIHNRATPDEATLPAKVSGYQLAPGDTLEIVGICGAGYGSPLEREVALVQKDVTDGLLCAATAESEYGVIIKDGEVDAGPTEALRRRRYRDAARTRD